MGSPYDIYIQLQTTPDSNGSTLFSFNFNTAVGVRGFQKTLNQWIKCFLTAKGSDIANKLYGTGFVDLLSSSYTSPQEIAEQITLTTADATAQIQAIQQLIPTTELPSEERLRSVDLLNIQNTTAGHFVVYLLFKNYVNQVVQYVLPVL